MVARSAVFSGVGGSPETTAKLAGSVRSVRSDKSVFRASMLYMSISLSAARKYVWPTSRAYGSGSRIREFAALYTKSPFIFVAAILRKSYHKAP